MKKTLIGLVVLAVGLPMAAMALPPVTLDESCTMIATLIGEYASFMGVVDDDLDPNLTDFESLTYDGEDWVWATGIPDVFKLALLGAAMCEDADLTDDFDANAAVFLTAFVDKLDLLVTYGTGGTGSAQAKIVAGGVAVQALFALGGVAGGFSAFLDVALPPQYVEYKPMIIAMCTDPTYPLVDDNDNGVFDYTDSNTNGVYDLGEPTEDIPGYIPYLCPTLAYIIQEDIGKSGSTTRQFAMGMRLGFANVVPALLSLNTPEFDGMTDLAENDLLADFREYQEQFALFGLIFHDIIAGYAGWLSTHGVPAAAAYYTPVHDAGVAFGAGAAAIAAIELPALPILGAVVKAAEDEPFGNAGDYDGNGFTNEKTYDWIVGHGGGAEEFVAAASGAEPITVPAAGIVGLAALVSAFAAGGAFVLRKK